MAFDHSTIDGIDQILPPNLLPDAEIKLKAIASCCFAPEFDSEGITARAEEIAGKIESLTAL